MIKVGIPVFKMSNVRNPSFSNSYQRVDSTSSTGADDLTYVAPRARNSLAGSWQKYYRSAKDLREGLMS
jgi:hypothetical protein